LKHQTVVVKLHFYGLQLLTTGTAVLLLLVLLLVLFIQHHHHLFAKNTNTTNEVHKEQLKQVRQG